MNTTILLCGVGGQGTILAAHILADAAMIDGYDVKVSEIHGMSQRGGAVTTVVVFGDEVNSMVSGPGEAEVVVAFEKLEAIRCLDQLKIGGMLVVNDIIIKPASVLTGKDALPSNADEILKSANALIIPAENEARAAGSIKASNVVLLGALSNALPISTDAFEKAISNNVPPKTTDINLNAFKAGRSFEQEHRS